MDQLITQRTRSLLQTRIRRIKSSGRIQYENNVQLLLNFLNENVVFKGIVESLVKESNLKYEHILELTIDGKPWQINSEKNLAAACYHALNVLLLPETDEQSIFGLVNGGRGGMIVETQDGLELINDYIIDPFYEFLDEAVDDRNTVLSLILKYKERCEWFRAEYLRRLAKDGFPYGKRGERGLMFDMYEYLHNQGIGFAIEPHSASGEADLVADQIGKEKIVLDGKYLGLSEGDTGAINKISKAFRQVYEYCTDFNTSVGYIVFYNCLGKALNIESTVSDGFQYVDMSGKCIFFFNIDIYDYGTSSASKRGTLGVINVNKEKLIFEK